MLRKKKRMVVKFSLKLAVRSRRRANKIPEACEGRRRTL
jgi:hypothetical protein